MTSLTLTKPDDWHVHFRDGGLLKHTVNASANGFARVLAMPNLLPPLTTVHEIHAYQTRILSVLSERHAQGLTPYFSLYLNESVHGETLEEAAADPFILGAKLYPAGATTHSEQGVKSIRSLYPLLEIMQTQGLVLQIHGEVTQGDIFDREALFLNECLAPIVKNFPKLNIVLEHISTKAAVTFVEHAPETVAATITPHHLLYNRNDLLVGGIKPHYYCLPILKRQSDQLAVQQAATSGNPKFFAGTDSAPHEQSKKESACGCAGIYSAPFALQLYAEIFEDLNHLPRLNNFTSRFGAEFYHLPVNKTQIELVKQKTSIPGSLPGAPGRIIPIRAGEILNWGIHDSE